MERQPVHGIHHSPIAQKEPVKSKDKDQKKGASASDHAMYLGMMALIEGISESENMGVSLAQMSKTLYDTLVKNGMNHIQDMQNQLSSLSYLQQNWAAYKAYADWEKKQKGPAPKVPDSDPAVIQKYVQYVNQFNNLSSYRSYVNAFSQQINAENTDVQNNKQIPDAMQDQVRSLVNNQGQYGAEVTSFLRVMQDQLRFS